MQKGLKVGTVRFLAGRWDKVLRRWVIIPALLLLALGSTGCVTVHEGGIKRTYIMPQVGVVLRVQNNCAPLIDIERPAEGVILKALPYGQSRTIPLSSVAFTGSSRQIPILVKGYTREGHYLGSEVYTYYVSTHQGTREDFLVVDRLRLSSGRSGCMGG
jgi:hypothetical protein